MESYHDMFRGSKGAFYLASSGIQNLIAQEVQVTIVSTICQENLVNVQAISFINTNLVVADINILNSIHYYAGQGKSL